MTGGEILLGQSVFEWLTLYGYWVLPLLILALGPVAGFTAGVFASLGVFNPFIIFAICVSTTVTTDSLFYALGKYGGRFLNRFKRSRRILYKIHKAEHAPGNSWMRTFREHFIKIFFFIKISPTVAIPEFVAVVSGVVNIKFRRFLTSSFLGQVVWIGVLISMGYYFGGAIQDVRFLVNSTGIIFATLFFFVFLYIRFVHQYFVGKMSRIMVSIKELLSSSTTDDQMEM